MNKEDKELLLKDLCARLPYGVYVEHTSGFRGTLHDLTVYFTYNDDDSIKDYMCYTNFFGDVACNLEFFKPYLFPMSSMTEEQKKELSDEICYFTHSQIEGRDPNGIMKGTIFEIDFYNKHHIDYIGLIDKGLAIDATGMNIY